MSTIDPHDDAALHSFMRALRAEISRGTTSPYELWLLDAGDWAAWRRLCEYRRDVAEWTQSYMLVELMRAFVGGEPTGRARPGHVVGAGPAGRDSCA